LKLKIPHFFSYFFFSELEIVQMSDEHRRILKSSWSVIYSEVGQALCYVNENGSSKEGLLYKGFLLQIDYFLQN